MWYYRLPGDDPLCLADIARLAKVQMGIESLQAFLRSAGALGVGFTPSSNVF